MTDISETHLRSPLRYPGGKTRVAKLLCSYLPAHCEYREVFLGGGAIFFYKRKAESNWINDLHPGLCALWVALRDHYEEFAELCRKQGPRGTREKFEEWAAKTELMRATGDECLVERAVQYYYINRTVWGGRVVYDPARKSRLYFSNPQGWSRLEAKLRHLRQCSQKLQGIKITCQSFEACLVDGGSDTLLYADPPYYRDSLDSPTSRLYEIDFPIQQHRKLRDQLEAFPGKVMVSYDDRPEVRELYEAGKRWRIYELAWKYCGRYAKTKQERANNHKETKVTGEELLILNYDAPPTALPSRRRTAVAPGFTGGRAPTSREGGTTMIQQDVYSPTRYVLLDANVIAAYYLPSSIGDAKLRPRVHDRISAIIESVKGGGPPDIVLYVPTICVVEVFGVFDKYRYGAWNRQVSTPISEQEYLRVVKEFEEDMDRRNVYVLSDFSRYHLDASRLVNRMDHSIPTKQLRPMKSADRILIGTGVQLAAIHGHRNFAIISGDRRLNSILKQAARVMSDARQVRALGLEALCRSIGVAAGSDALPQSLDLFRVQDNDLLRFFHIWPLPQPRALGQAPDDWYARYEPLLLQLIDEARDAGVSIDRMPYTRDFEALYLTVLSRTGLRLSRREVYRRMMNARKASKASPKKTAVTNDDAPLFDHRE